MAKVDGSISSLIQGVSQQPARERLAGQCELQINCSSDPVKGLTRRGPTKWLSTLLTSASSYTVFDYDAGSIGHFILAYKANDLKVFDTAGTEYTVTVDGDADDYIPDSGLRFAGVNVDDTEAIYLLNPNITSAMVAGSKSYVDNAALVFWLGGQYGRTYRIKIEMEVSGTPYSINVSYTTPDGSSSSHIANIATTYIATQLETALNANGTFTTYLQVDREDDVLYISWQSPTSDTFEVTVEDGDGGSNMFSLNNEAPDAGGLPKYAPQGYIAKISESGTSDDDWYVEFVTAESGVALGDGFGQKGVWAEAVAPGVDYQLDAETMPHVLEKTGATTFTLRRATWEERAAGDDNTNPVPSFIGKTINDIGSFQGRLALLSDVNCVLSRPNEPTDFFNQSATTLADDDPIDVASALGTYVLRRMVPHNRDLVIFSDRAQFVMFGRNYLTPKNSSLVLTTEFDADLSASPVGAGRNVIFAFKYGNYTGAQEFYTDGGEDVNDARPITQHVSKYIQGTADKLTSTTNFNKLLVSTSLSADTLYVYEYVWQNKQKVQASWSTWQFSYDILHTFFVDNLLYMIQKDGNAYDLVTLDLDDTATSGVGYRVMLDQQEAHTGVNTTFTTSYTIGDIDDYVAVQGAGCPNAGMRVPIVSESSGTVTLGLDMEGGTVHFGRRYTSRFIPTSPFVRDENGVKVDSGRLTIKSYTIHFSDTGYFDVLMSDNYEYSAEESYNGRVVGDPNNVVGSPSVIEGSFNVPFYLDADTSTLELQTNSHLPMNLTELAWDGTWRKKGKRITGG